MPTPLLVVVRHGRTEWNATGRFQGRADPPLDRTGRRQAEECAEVLAACFERAGLPTPVIISSDLRRAADTAAAVAGAFAGTYLTDEGLREVDVGGWEGLTAVQVRDRFPDQYRLWSAGADVRRGGGETLAEAGRRVADRIEQWWDPVGPAPLVAVGHGMATQSALAELRSRTRVEFPGDPPHLANGAWLALAPPGGGPPPIG